MHRKLFTFKNIKDVLLVVIGTALLSFSNLIFLSKANINTGGLNGVAIIVRYVVSNDPNVMKLTYNITIAALSVILWLLGLIFLGKDFAIKTLISTIVFPVANFIFSYVPGIAEWIESISDSTFGDGSTGNLVLCSVFSGVFVGLSVSLTFLGGGSSGGLDVLAFILEKFVHIKQSIGTFVVDGLIILTGIFVLPKSYLVNCLCGVIAAFLTAALIDYIFIGSQSSYQVDVISDKWEDINHFAQYEIDRGATIIRAQGGYKQEGRIILRVVVDRRSYLRLQAYIAEIDPKAFMTVTRTNAVYGEGFRKHEKSLIEARKKKDGK